MGIIIRQGIKHSIVRYSAIFLGLLSTLFVYPLVLDEIGLIRTIQSIALVMAPIAHLGANVAALRFFPKFNTDNLSAAGFFSRLNRTTLYGSIIVSILYLIFQDNILEIYQVENNEYSGVFILIPIFITLIAYSQLYETYTANYMRIAIPAALGELSLKIILPTIMLIYIGNYISIQETIYLLLFTYLLLDISLLIYLKAQVKGPLFARIPKLTAKLRNEIRSFSAYNLFTSLSILISIRIDIIMLSAMTNFTVTGIYSINMLVGEVIDAPRQAFIKIINPIVSQAYKDDDLQKVQELYQNTSKHMFLASLLLFVGIISSIDDLYTIMPNGEVVATGKQVIYLLGATKLIDGAFGINSIVLQHSKWYKFLLYAVCFLASVNILNNYLLIPDYQMVGAATATLISGLGFNILKFIRIKQKLGFQPFTWKIPLIFIVGVIAFCSGLLIPSGIAENAWMAVLTIILRSVLVGSVFLSLAIGLKISPELNGLIRTFISKYLKK